MSKINSIIRQRRKNSTCNRTSSPGILRYRRKRTRYQPSGVARTVTEHYFVVMYWSEDMQTRRAKHFWIGTSRTKTEAREEKAFKDARRFDRAHKRWRSQKGPHPEAAT